MVVAAYGPVSEEFGEIPAASPAQHPLTSPAPKLLMSLFSTKFRFSGHAN